MLRIAIAAVCLVGFAPRAESATCTRSDRYASLAGYGEALVCGGEPLSDVWVQFDGDDLTGISWTEYQGDKLRRTIRVDHLGRISFISQDEAIKGGFFAQTRGTSHFLFPRGRKMSVTKHPDALRLVFRDAAGRAWHLVGKPLPRAGSPRVSYTVTAVDDHDQATHTIDFTSRGIVAVDLVAPYSLYLQHQEPHMHGLADRRARAYLAMKSTFHDGRGQTCEVANEKLFQPRAGDPDDKADNELRFADDASLVEFLGATCPKLDLTVLGVRAQLAR